MIGIYGDSFADLNPQHLHNRKKEIWPWGLWLGEYYNEKVECHALSATPIWYSYQKFLDTYRKYDKIVFTYTNYRRWNTLSDKYVMLSHIRDEVDVPLLIPEFQSIGKLLVDAFPVLYRDELNKFIYQHVFNEVNRLCKKYNIKIVNLMPFENTTYYFPKGIGEVIDFSQTTGPVVTGVMTISHKEIDFTPRLRERLQTKNDLRHCHLNSYNNKMLANIIFENLHTTNVKNVSGDVRFKYDDEYLIHAFDETDV